MELHVNCEVSREDYYLRFRDISGIHVGNEDYANNREITFYLVGGQNVKVTIPGILAAKVRQLLFVNPKTVQGRLLPRKEESTS